MPQFNEGNINSYLVPSGSLTGSLSNSGTLTGQIAIGSGGGTTNYNDLTNKPSINSITLSGNKTTADLNISYNDLDDKPTIPAAQVNSDWNAESGVAQILNKPTLATVATTGDYDDLTDKPTIPSALNDLSDVNINNPYQTDVLSYNESTSKWINHPVSLTVEGLANVGLSTPIVGKVLKVSSVSSAGPTWKAANVKYSEIDNTPALATVATSGSYDDLIDKPTVETTCSITRGPTMPNTFPVPDIIRRGNVVVIRFAVLLPAGTYDNSTGLWIYSPGMVGFTGLTFPVYGSGVITLLKILPNGVIALNNTQTFNSDTWLIGEAAFLTDG